MYLRFVLLKLAVLGVIFNAKAQTGSNPIFRNKWTADPAPMLYNGTLYVNVGQDSATGSQQYNMLSWLSYSTTDMKNWTYHGPILKPTDFKWGQAGTAWASQMVEANGKFYYYVTVTGNSPYGGRNIAVAVANSPTGPFVDARASFGSPLVQDNMTTGGDAWDDIDPTILIEEDGTAYLCWGHGTCYLAKLKPNMIELAGAIQKITPANGSYTEGPWLHKRNGIYYLTYAAIVNGGSEQINYATASNLNGPFTYQGVLTGNAKNSYTIHPGIIQYNSQWYLFYHNATLSLNGLGGTTGRRSVCVDYLCYNTDGTYKSVTQTTAGVTVTSPCPPSTIAQAPFKGTPWPIPGRIEAEDYDLGGEGVAFHEANTDGNQGGANYRNDEVDIETTQDVDGAYDIGYILNGEWLEYTVNVSSSDKYNLSLRVAADGISKTMHAEMDGQNITGAIAIPNTGGFQTWQTAVVPNLSLTAGKHTLRLAFDADYFNINYMRFDKATVTEIGEGDGFSFGISPTVVPNPFENNFRIPLDGEYTYKLYDTSGKLIVQGMAAKEVSIGENLPIGIYFLQIMKGENSYKMKVQKN